MKIDKTTYSSMLCSESGIKELEKMWDNLEGISYLEKEPFKKRIFFDMDGTLFLWQYKLQESFVMPNGEILPKGTPVTDELWNNPTTHYYAHIPPYEELVDFVNDELLNRDDVEVFILSKSPSFAIKDKLDSINKYLPNVPKDHIILCPYGEYSKTNFLDKVTENDFLFDDFSPNLREWQSNGGQAVNVLNTHNKVDELAYNINVFDSESIRNFFEEHIFEKEQEIERF